MTAVFPSAMEGNSTKRETIMAHKHGSMDTTAQEKTFNGFIRLAVWVAAISIGILIFMALVNA